jgi:hypothetical protein
VLVLGYALSLVAALGALFVGFTSLTADPSVSCARSLGKVDQGCRAQTTLLQAWLFIIGLTVAPASVLASVRSPHLPVWARTRIPAAAGDASAGRFGVDPASAPRGLRVGAELPYEPGRAGIFRSSRQPPAGTNGRQQGSGNDDAATGPGSSSPWSW